LLPLFKNDCGLKNLHKFKKKCNNDVKRHDNFTKLILFIIGVMF